MDEDRAKRGAEEVLFKWDDAVDPKRRLNPGLLSPEWQGSTPTVDPLSSRIANVFHNVSAPRVLPAEKASDRSERLDVKQLRETIANIHLTHNRDWLAANNRVTALAKLDVLDRISCAFLNRESAMKYESLRYLQRECSTEFEFNRMIYENRLQRINAPLLPELCVQPVYVRNSTLLSKMKNKCGCPLHVYIEWDLRQSTIPAQINMGGPLGSAPTITTPPATRPSLNLSDTDGFHTAREGAGSNVGLHASPTSSPTENLPASLGFSLNKDPGSGDMNNSTQNRETKDTNRIREGLLGLLERRGITGQETWGNWSLTASDRMPGSQMNVQPSLQCMENMTQHNKNISFEHLEAVCPMHVATALPEMFVSGPGAVGVIPELELLYKCGTTSVGGNTIQMLSFRHMAEDTKVFHYRLPSVLQSINFIYLRDFEFERYNSTVDLNQDEHKDIDNLRKSYLSAFYSGPALMLVTASEFIIAVVRNTKNNLALGVISRESNPGLVIGEVLCHRASGRVFMLADNSLMYEYQYQLGSVDVKSYSIIGMFFSALAKGYRCLLKALNNDKVFRLYGTVPSGYSMELDAGVTGEHGGPDHKQWWESGENCLEDFNHECPVSATVYWPPLQWRELHLSLQESSFADHYSKETCECVQQQSCVKRELRTCLKLLNPWCKSYFKMFSCGKSKLCLDQNRWLLSLLSDETGDLSVFKIPEECSLDTYLKGVLEFDQIFPYSLTFFSLRNSDLIQQLSRAGYFRLVGDMSNFKCCSVLTAPLNMNNGVDIILVDKFGTRIYIGFILEQNVKLNLVVKGFKVSQTLVEYRTQLQRPTTARFGYLGRLQMPGLGLRPIPVKRSYHYAGEMFLACEYYAKTVNMTLCKVTVYNPENASLCQASSPIPQSISEELWSYNQRLNSGKGITDQTWNQARAKPVEWFDEFCLLMSPAEEVIRIYADNSEKTTGVSTPTDRGSKLVIVTSHKIYTLRRGDTFRIVEALLKNPISTLKYLEPPLIHHNHRGGIFALKNCSMNQNSGRVNFVDIFQDKNRDFDLCGEAEKKEAIANGLYYLCWLYTPEEVFKACWHFMLDNVDPLLEDMLLSGSDELSLMITSMGISSSLFGWSAPGAYSLDDEGKPATPVISPWCKFVVFNEQTMFRFNRISTNLTSPGVDGILSLVLTILEPIWLDRAFVCAPLFTSVMCPQQDPNSAVPFSPRDQINKRNEFLIGPKFECDLTLTLARPVEEIKGTLSRLRKLYLLLLRVAQNYEHITPKAVERMAENVSRLALNLQRDIFLEESHEGELISSTSDAFDASVVLRRLTQRRDQDFRMIKEMVTLLEITQEYLACCILLHRNCFLGDVDHEFSKMIQDVQLLPSKSHGRFTCSDLFNQGAKKRPDPVVLPFAVQHVRPKEKPKNGLTMSRQFFYLISNSNMLNLCSNKEFFRAFRVAVWLAGGELSNLQDHFYGHMFKSEELRVKHWSNMVRSLEKQLVSADDEASVSHYARLLMKFIGERHNLT